MKTIRFLRAAIVLLGIVLNACAPAVPAIGGGKGLADVIFSGVIESMNGDQWVVSGQTIKVDPSVLRDGPFAVGDTVKVEASKSEDGTVIAQRVETPDAAVPAEAVTSAPDDSSSSVDNSATPQAPVFDNQGNEAVGTVDAMTDTSITVGGQTYTFAPGAEIKGDVVTGSSVKLHFTVNADGSLSVTELELTAATQVSDTKSNDVNDDHGGTTTSSDDGANHDTNDDHGGNSNSGGDDNSGSNSGGGG